MNKNIFILILSISTFSLSSCIKMPEKEIGIEPIFIEESENLEKISDFEKISETKNSSGEIIAEIKDTDDTISTGEILEEKTVTGEIISGENNLILEGENEVISEKNSEEEILNSTGEIISKEDTENKSSTGEILENEDKNEIETSTGENL